MSPEELKALFDLIADGGALAVLATIVWALLAEKVVPKSRLDACEKRNALERDERKSDEEFARKTMAEGMTRLERLASAVELNNERLRETMDDIAETTRRQRPR